MNDSINGKIFSDEELEKLHEKCFADTLISFNNFKILNKNFDERFDQKINEIMSLEFEKFKQINKANLEHNEERKILNQKLRFLEIETDRLKEEVEIREPRYTDVEKDVSIIFFNLLSILA
jgi:hypothetical protein